MAKGSAGSMGARDAAGAASALRPQSLMLSFLGIYVLGQGTAVFSRSVIDVFGRVGVSQQATRSTLTRMVKRDLLRRHRRGQRMYFGLTPRCDAVLREGQQRVWHTGVVNRDWDGNWTMLGFSLPENWQSQRHSLRSRLVWAGFGPLQSGMWVCPSRVNVPALVADLGLDSYLKVMVGRPAPPTGDSELINGAFDIPGIAARYQAFLHRWGGPQPLAGAPDDLARQLLLHAEWLQLIRKAPRLPAGYLPAEWPAIHAERLFERLAAAYADPAKAIASALLDTIGVGPPGPHQVGPD
jgi:phenylacetic acid degradation operon negative regulatory protein